MEKSNNLIILYGRAPKNQNEIKETLGIVRTWREPNEFFGTTSHLQDGHGNNWCFMPEDQCWEIEGSFPRNPEEYWAIAEFKGFKMDDTVKDEDLVMETLDKFIYEKRFRGYQVTGIFKDHGAAVEFLAGF